MWLRGGGTWRATWGSDWSVANEGNFTCTQDNRAVHTPTSKTKEPTHGVATVEVGASSSPQPRSCGGETAGFFFVMCWVGCDQCVHIWWIVERTLNANACYTHFD